MKQRGHGDKFEEHTASQLNVLLRQFYAEARTRNGGKYSKAALTGLRAGINRYLRNPPYHRQFCIMTDQAFSSSNQTLTGLLKSMKREGKDKSKHHTAIVEADLEKIRQSPAVGYSTPSALQRKVYFDLSYHFGRRGREGLRNLTKESYIVKTDAQGLRYVEADFREAEKNHALDNYQHMATMYEIPKKKEQCPVRAYTFYLSKLHPDNDALFQRPRPTIPAEGPWYCNAPVGIKTLGKMMADISEKAGLSQRYTNHCVRATTCVQLDRAGYDTQEIMAITGHRNEASVRSYTSRMHPQRARDISYSLSSCPIPQPLNRAAATSTESQAPPSPTTMSPIATVAAVVQPGVQPQGTPPHTAPAEITAAAVSASHASTSTHAPVLFPGCVFHGNVTVYNLPK